MSTISSSGIDTEIINDIIVFIAVYNQYLWFGDSQHHMWAKLIWKASPFPEMITRNEKEKWIQFIFTQEYGGGSDGENEMYNFLTLVRSVHEISQTSYSVTQFFLYFQVGRTLLQTVKTGLENKNIFRNFDGTSWNTFLKRLWHALSYKFFYRIIKYVY